MSINEAGVQMQSLDGYYHQTHNHRSRSSFDGGRETLNVKLFAMAAWPVDRTEADA